jgi:hypothetical protein
MSAKIAVFALILAALIAGCGVRLEVATPIAPTTTPRWFPNYDPSSGGIWRPQARPRVVFGETPQASLFMEPQDEVLLVAYRATWMDVPYDVTWFASPRSSVQISITAYTRPDSEAPWERWDSAQRLLTTAEAPAYQQDSVGVALYYEEPRWLQARTEVSITAYLENGNIINQVDVNEFNVQVLSDPGEISTDVGGLWPAFGEFNGLLLDWRAWSGGACEQGLDEACSAFEEGDLGTAGAQLWEAATAVEDDDYRRAEMKADAALMAAVAGDYSSARDAFASAIEDYRAADSVWETSLNLHNLAAVLFNMEDQSGYEAIERLAELRGQFYDEPGIELTQANTAYLSGDRGLLEDSLYYFEDRQLPQQDIVRMWLEDMGG